MSIEAMKQALEALDNLLYWDNGKPEYDEARKALEAGRQAIAEAEKREASQEPVARDDADIYTFWAQNKDADKHYQPLTYKQIIKIGDDLFYSNGPCDTLAFARAIEAAHGIGEKK